jgi:hypothetical protein
VDDNAKRHRPPTPRRELPQHLGSLVHQARLRGVRLLIMPPGMTCHTLLPTADLPLHTLPNNHCVNTHQQHL